MKIPDQILEEIRQIKNQHGVDVSVPHRRWTSSLRQRVEALLESGVSPKELSRATGIGAGTLHYWRRALKVKSFQEISVMASEPKITTATNKVSSNLKGSVKKHKNNNQGGSAKLGDYSRSVMTDGHKSYDNVLAELKVVPRAYCWSHARREFLPLESHDPTVKPILDLMDKLFEVERRAKSFAELQLLREQESSRLPEELKILLQAELVNSRLGSQKRKVIEYFLSCWQGLTLFLKDTRVPLSNNEAKRRIRHSVVGRKNFYGSGSHSGAATAVTIYTVIESYKKNDLDPRTFMLMSLQHGAQGAEFETPLSFARRTHSSQDVDEGGVTTPLPPSIYTRHHHHAHKYIRRNLDPHFGVNK